MNDYNDYIKATRGYLKNYKQLRTTMKNLEQEAQEKRQLLASTHISISKYDMGGGGEGRAELTSTEAEAFKRGRIEEEIEQIAGEVNRIRTTMEKLDNAIESLDGTKKRLIQGYYLDGMTWRELSIELYITEKWAANSGGNAVKEIAFMIFGSKALPPEKKFIFL